MKHRVSVTSVLTIIGLVTLTLPVLWLATPASAQVATTGEPGCSRWVASGGLDDNPGDRARPWATLQHAADSVRPGDTVCVAAGTYPIDEELELTASGSAGAPITFTTLGEDVTLRGGVSFARGVSHLRLHGFTVTGFRVWGVTIHGDSEDILLSGLTVRGGEAGIHLTVGASGETPHYGPVKNITIEDCVVSGSEYTAVDCTPGPCDDLTLRRLEVHGSGATTGYSGDGIAVERGSNVVVEDCFVHDNGGDGVDLNSRDVGRTMPGVMVRRNRVVGNGLNGVKVWVGGRVENNLIANCGETALVLESGSYEVVNNTVASISSYNYLAVLGNYDNQYPVQLRLYSNIFFNNDPQMGGTLVFFPRLVTLEADNNLYFNPYREEDVICADFLGEGACFGKDDISGGTWHARSSQGGSSLYADPAFSSPASGDFTLSSSSPAVGAGAATFAPATDLKGGRRDDMPDIGAYERGAIGAVGTVSSRTSPPSPAVPVTGPETTTPSPAIPVVASSAPSPSAPVPAVTLSGGDVGFLYSLDGGGSSRVGVGLANLGASSSSVRITLFDEAGTSLGGITLDVAAGAWPRIGDVVSTTGAYGRSLSYATVTVEGGSGPVWAFATLQPVTGGEMAFVPLSQP